ncbi:MAG: GxxExxY protein [Paludibacteraceae bacterium]|nr:GxxExxY protein [Paludibacteraceae bacterium]
MSDLSQYKQTTYHIIGAAMEVHGILGWGLVEPIYQEALEKELKLRGLLCEREKEVPIRYKDFVLDKRFRIDMLVEDVVVELKSVAQLKAEHREQLCNYLRLTQKRVGLLINFGERSLIGERWAFDKENNTCFLINKNMQPINQDYDSIYHFQKRLL